MTAVVPQRRGERGGKSMPGSVPEGRRRPAAAGRIEYAWIGGPTPATVVFLHEGLGSLAMWKDFRGLCGALGMRGLVYAREVTAGRRRAHTASAGPWSSCNARRWRCCRRCCASECRASVALRPQRRRLDRASVRGRVSDARGGRDRGRAASLRRGRGRASIEATRTPTSRPTCARGSRATMTTPIPRSSAGTTSGSIPRSARGTSSAMDASAARCSRSRARTTNTGRWRRSTASPRRAAGAGREARRCGHSPHRDQPEA